MAREEGRGNKGAYGSHGDSHQKHAQEAQGKGDHQAQQHKATGADDMKEREYRDAQGNIHHHTKKYMGEHGSAGDEEKGSSGKHGRS